MSGLFFVHKYLIIIRGLFSSVILEENIFCKEGIFGVLGQNYPSVVFTILNLRMQLFVISEVIEYGK